MLRLAVLWSLVAALAAETEGSRLVSQGEIPFQGAPGYHPLCLTLGTDRATTVRWRFRSDMNAIVLEGQTELKDGERRRLMLVLPQPCRSLEILVPLAQEWDIRPIAGTASALIIVGDEMPADWKDGAPIHAAVPDPYMSYPGGADATLARLLAPALLPDRWQCYSNQLTLLLLPDGERRLEEAQREAIATWAMAGGALVVETPEQAAAWRRRGAPTRLRAQLTFKNDTVRRWRNGKEENDPIRYLDLAGTPYSAFDQNQMDPSLAVPGTLSGSGLGYALVVVVFAIVAGPLNLWWAYRRRKPLLLLITIPALGAVTCLLLLAWDMTRLGVSLRRATLEFTWLDQPAARAVQFAGGTWFGAFAANRLDLPVETRLSLPWRQSHDWDDRRAAGSSRLWWDEAQHWQGLLIRARTNTLMAAVTPRPERRRLHVSRTAAGWSAVNGLDAQVTRLVWFDDQRRAWSVEGLAPGETAELHASAKPASRPEVELTTLLPIGSLACVTRIGEPGTFLATLARPFAELPLPGRDATPTKAFLAGLAPPDQTGATP